MAEPTAPHVSTSTTQPQPVLNNSAPPRRPAPAAARQRGLRTRISGMRDALIAGALVMAAAGTARITQLRHVMRRDRRKSSAG
jgi:hypothetical protein